MTAIDRRLITPRPATSGFGAELRRMRCEHRLSQSRLADRASLDHSYISRLESGARVEPSRDTIEALADAMELTPDERMRLLVASGFVPDDARELLHLWGQLPMSWRLQLVSIAKAVVEGQEAA